MARKAQLSQTPILAKPKLPRGVNKLPRRQIVRHQRARLIEAIGHAVAARGYADTSVSDVLARAGVSRTTFYQLFKDKEDCFLQGLNHLADHRLRTVEEADAAASLPEQLHASIAAYMRALDFDPQLTHAYVVQAQAASPAIRAALVKSGDRMEAAMLRDWYERVRAAYPEVPPCHPLTLRALREGVIGVIVERIENGGPSFSDDVARLATFVLSAFGLFKWAHQSEGGGVATGRPR